jgi:hypothetical protein
MPEFPGFIISGNGIAGGDKPGIEFRFGARVREFTVKLLVDKTGAAAGNVDHLADQVTVDALLEVGKIEINVIDAAAELGSIIVAQVFRVQVIEVGARLDEGAA